MRGIGSTYCEEPFGTEIGILAFLKMLYGRLKSVQDGSKLEYGVKQ